MSAPASRRADRAGEPADHPPPRLRARRHPPSPTRLQGTRARDAARRQREPQARGMGAGHGGRFRAGRLPGRGARRRPARPCAEHAGTRRGGRSSTPTRTADRARRVRRRLAGRTPDARGFIRCPAAGHPDRHPSAHLGRDASEGWHCFACGAGGAIYDFASALLGGPTGRDLRSDGSAAPATSSATSSNPPPKRRTHDHTGPALPAQAPARATAPSRSGGAQRARPTRAAGARLLTLGHHESGRWLALEVLLRGREVGPPFALRDGHCELRLTIGQLEHLVLVAGPAALARYRQQEAALLAGELHDEPLPNSCDARAEHQLRARGAATRPPGSRRMSTVAAREAARP